MNKIEVSQRAREAYLSLSMLPEFDAIDVREGRWDKTTGLQAFARFERDILATRTDATPVAEAWATLESAMQDPEYAWGWHCNLAMPIMDATGITHEQANMAAAHLMQHLWKCDITTNPHYEYKKSDAQSYAEFRIEADKAEGDALPDAHHPPATDVAALVEAAKAFQHYGCPVCSGDCGSANPPVIACPMKDLSAALAPFTKGQNDDA